MDRRHLSTKSNLGRGLRLLVVAGVLVLGLPLVATSAGASNSATVLISNLDHPYDLAFDTAGNLYIAGGFDDAIDRVSASELTSLSPTVMTVATVTDRVVGLAFDSAGDLFFVAQGNGNVYELTAAQLADPAPETPTVFLTLPSSSDEAIVFDAAGDLFVAGDESVYEVTAAQMVSSSPSDQTVATLSDPTYGLAVDAAGDLFVSEIEIGLVVEITAAQIALNTPVTSVAAVYAGQLNDVPWGLGFDADGNLYISDTYDSQILEVSSAQLATNTGPYPTSLYFEDSIPSLPIGVVWHDGHLYSADVNSSTIDEYALAAPLASPPASVTALNVAETSGLVSASWGPSPTATTYTCTLLFAFNDPSQFTVTTTSPTCSFQVPSTEPWGISVTANNSSGSSAPVAAFGTAVVPAPARTSLVCVKGKHAKRVYGTPAKCPKGWHKK